MYVTNNERGRDNEIFMSSPSGQIRTYLLPSNQDNQAPIYPETVATNPSTPPMTPRIVPPEIRGRWMVGLMDSFVHAADGHPDEHDERDGQHADVLIGL